MSELKAVHVVDVYDEYSADPYKEAQVYLKSEADREIRNQKRKRCLALARWCFTKSNYHFVLARHGEDAKENNRRSILYSKWRNRWLKIA